MSAKLPPPPELPPKPPASWLSIALVMLFGMALAMVLTVLTLGYFGPVLLLGAAIFMLIGLQYLLWGWLFERIYRPRPDQDDKLPPP
jgi:drug/metabolite transporter (DMT)-like permease